MFYKLLTGLPPTGMSPLSLRVTVRKFLSRAAFYLFVVARVGAVFLQFCEGRSSFAHVDQLQAEQIFHNIAIHVCKVISA